MQLFVSLLLATLSFASPVHIHVQLAGNFGEPRPNHFHGGIDIKTERGVNFGVYSIANGYVSRAIVGEYGFGRALVIAHPNGYSSFYVHLNRFAPQIQAAVERWQYTHHSYNGDIHFQPGEIPVGKGQFVALSGNTGASQGPHLHLEMHQTATGNLMDPMNWLSHIVPDTEAPTAYSFKSYPQAGQGVFQNTQESRIYSFGNTRYRAWGKVGFGTWAYDHMDSVYNNYGVRHTELYCDGKLIYKSDVNNIPQQCNRMINVWGDYEHFASHRIWYLKSFREPGNRLPFITTNATGGIVNFNQPREYHLQYVFSDYYGNKTVKDIYVQGTPQAIPPAQPIGGANALLVNRNNNVAFGSALLQVKGSLLARNCLLQPQQTTLANALSAGYRFAPLSLPLLAYTPLKIKITAPIGNTSKLYMAAIARGSGAGAPPMYCGGSYKDGWLQGNIRDLGLVYYVAHDNTPPTIRQTSGNPASLTFHLSDTGTGVKSYEAYIDNKFVLFEQGKDRSNIFCDLRKTPIPATKTQHTLRIVATDRRQNVATYTTKITY